MIEFEDIRPYYDEEVPAAIYQLVRDGELCEFLAGWLAPKMHRLFPVLVETFLSWYLRYEFRRVKNIASFQDVVSGYAKKLVFEGTTSFVFEGFETLDPAQAYLFISNHRDIAGDSMLLDYALYLSGLPTVRIAIGDNLIQRNFATSLMRLNKGFFIKRSVEGPRKVYAALVQSSEYIAHSIRSGQSVWIAQSEGRSKDGFDLTDPAIVKMFALRDRKSPLGDAISGLNIIPLSLSYELDPCDTLKAKELTSRALHGTYEKPEGEDLLAMVKGLSGQKGRVVLRLGKKLDQDFENADSVAEAIDRQIVSMMEFFPVNYWALAQINEPEYRTAWEKLDISISAKDAAALEQRLLACPETDRACWLKMYANPILNRDRILGRLSS